MRLTIDIAVCQHLLSKADIVKYKLDKDMDKVGIHDYSKIAPYPNLVKQRQYYIKLQKQVEATGYKPISQECYKDMVQKAFKTEKSKK